MTEKAINGGANQTVSSRAAPPFLSRLLSKPLLVFQKLGPGVVTGAADDDPSGIATYSQVGAQFGFTVLWTMVLTYPLMAGIQEISAWIGRVTGVGIAGNIRRHYSPLILYPLVALLLIANMINLGADIGAMGSALQMLVGGSALLYSVVFGLISMIAATLVPYRQYSQLLKWSGLVLFVYIGTASQFTYLGDRC
jgi:Mn2+/Fe2+ NRAMP family transporter